MTYVPPMSFEAGDLLKGRSVIDGPIVVYWGQDEEVYYRGEKPLDYGPRPRRRLIDRVRRGRTWRLTLRIAPPQGVPLKEFGQDICRILGLQYGGDPAGGHLAIWIPGSCKSRSASGALSSAGRVFDRLGGLNASAVQVRVEEWPEQTAE